MSIKGESSDFWKSQKSIVEFETTVQLRPKLEASLRSFGVLVNWTFSGKFLIPEVEPKMYREYASAYRLADFLLMPTAKNKIIHALLNHWQATDTDLTFDGLRGICKGNAMYDGSPEMYSPLFSLCIQSATYRFMKHKAKDLDDSLIEYPEAILAILKSVEQWNTTPFERPQAKDKCIYHDHKGERVCGK